MEARCLYGSLILMFVSGCGPVPASVEGPLPTSPTDSMGPAQYLADPRAPTCEVTTTPPGLPRVRVMSAGADHELTVTRQRIGYTVRVLPTNDPCSFRLQVAKNGSPFVDALLTETYPSYEGDELSIVCTICRLEFDVKQTLRSVIPTRPATPIGHPCHLPSSTRCCGSSMRLRRRSPQR